MIMRFMCFLSVLLATPSVLAGSAQAQINCVSASGKTRLEAVIPGDSDEARVTLTLDAKSSQPTVVTFINRMMIENMSLNSQDPSQEFPNYQSAIIGVVNPEKIKALTILVMEEETFNGTLLSLVARPETLKIVRKDWSAKGIFKAELNGRDPRQEGGFLQSIALSCSYDYSI